MLFDVDREDSKNKYKMNIVIFFVIIKDFNCINFIINV